MTRALWHCLPVSLGEGVSFRVYHAPNILSSGWGRAGGAWRPPLQTGRASGWQWWCRWEVERGSFSIRLHENSSHQTMEGRQDQGTGCSGLCRWRINWLHGCGISEVRAYDLIGNSSCFFPSFFSFVSPANSAPWATSPRGENQEAARKLGTTSSSFIPKELKKEVFGRKNVKVDKNLGGSWKYSGEQGTEGARP